MTSVDTTAPASPGDGSNSISDYSIDATVDRAMSLLGRADAPTPAAEDGGAENAPADQPAATDEEATTRQPDDDAQRQEASQEQPSESSAPKPDDQPKYRVKVRGAEVEVPLNELLEGYSRTEDYKAKTAEVAEQRRVVEQSRADYTARLNQLINHVENFDPVIAEARSIDWARLAQEDPASYVQKQAALNQRMAVLQHMQAERDRQTQQAHMDVLQREQAALVEKVPAFADKAQREKLVSQAKAVMREYGYTDDELATWVDHRAVRAAVDLARLRDMEKAAKAVEAKKAPIPAPRNVVKPGNSNVERSGKDRRVEALKNRAIQSGKTADAVEAILALTRN